MTEPDKSRSCDWCKKTIEIDAKVCHRCGRHQGLIGRVPLIGTLVGTLIAILGAVLSMQAAQDSKLERETAEMAKRQAEAALTLSQKLAEEADETVLRLYVASARRAAYEVGACIGRPEVRAAVDKYPFCRGEVNTLTSLTIDLSNEAFDRFDRLPKIEQTRTIEAVCTVLEHGLNSYLIMFPAPRSNQTIDRYLDTYYGPQPNGEQRRTAPRVFWYAHCVEFHQNRASDRQ